MQARRNPRSDVPLGRFLVWTCLLTIHLGVAANAALVHHWPLDESGGLAAPDVASGADATLLRFENNDDTHWVPGQVNGGLSLAAGPSLSNHMTADIPAMDASESGGFTIMMWVQPGSIVANVGEYQLFYSPDGVIGLTIYNAVFQGRSHVRQLLFWDGDLSRIVLGGTHLRPGDWYHVAVTSTGRGGERRLYVNGDREAKHFLVSSGGVDAGNADGWTAGGALFGAFNGNGGRWHNSALDDVRIYDAALSDAEVLGVYLEGTAVKDRFTRGDVNADEKMDLSDAVVILTYLFSDGNVTCLDAADSNDDGKLDLADAVGVLGHLFGDDGPLPAPFGECGEDPAADDLSCDSYAPCE